MKNVILILSVLALAAAVTTLHAQAPSVNVTNAQILNPTPDSWPTYNGDYSGRRFSTLTKINDKNVKFLSLAWTSRLPGSGIIKATPLLVNGTLYLSTMDHAYAIDARTGRPLWHYTWIRNRGGLHIGNRG